MKVKQGQKLLSTINLQQKYVLHPHTPHSPRTPLAIKSSGIHTVKDNNDSAYMTIQDKLLNKQAESRKQRTEKLQKLFK